MTLKLIHPGIFVKENVIPEDLSVKDAANLLGIGRPALSNFVNGNSSLSIEMAVRLEKTFGANKEQLLKLQIEFDQYEMQEKEKDISVRIYSPILFSIKANQIQIWADTIEARAFLAAFLRGLINTTGQNISKIDFPAYDNSQRHGWDGYLESDTTTPWIPKGISGWEFGTNKGIKKKAEEDYNARTNNIPFDERKNITFIFVTPRNWVDKEKSDWINEKKDKEEWKDIRVYDANDLEQWLEQSIPSQIWFAEKIGINTNGILSLDLCWHKWSTATEPNLNNKIFSDSVDLNKEKLTKWLTTDSKNPLIVTADSKDEALAFISCIFSEIGDCYKKHYDQVIIAYNGDSLRKIIKGNSQIVAVIASEEAENIITEGKSIKAIIVRSKTSIIYEPDIQIEIPSYESFKKSLMDMGFNEDEVSRYSRESGQSPTILRRRLTNIPSIQIPSWSKDKEIVRSLIPLILVGVWKSENISDQQILSYLSYDEEYIEIEKNIAEILKVEESPLWSISNNKGVISKLDSLFLVNNLITKDDIELFFEVAEIVLCEDNPALDLPEDKQWAANLYDKTREHSSILRNGLCETLVLFSTHGEYLFQKRLGINIQLIVNNLIETLLNPLDSRTWLSQQRDLPSYAEAAPDKFLSILEEDLKNNDPQVLRLLKPVGNSITGNCDRTGLIWALELLAWNPLKLAKVCLILARLSQIDINDNWVNKPINTLYSIFRSWMPQTKAKLEDRLTVLKNLIKKYPNIAWKICIEQFEVHSRIGHFNYKPKWKNNAVGAGNVVTIGEDRNFRLEILKMLLNWENYDEKMLAELITRLEVMPEDQIENIWKLFDNWIKTSPDDEKKSYLREEIRKYAFTKRGIKRTGEKIKDYARDAYDALLPNNLITRHKWLFAKYWIEESYEELKDEGFDYEKRTEWITNERAVALKEIYHELGIDGLINLLEVGNASNPIGYILSKYVIRHEEIENFVKNMFLYEEHYLGSKIDDCISGFLRGIETQDLIKILSNLINQFGKESNNSKVLKLLINSPFNKDTWTFLKQFPKDIQIQYWESVPPPSYDRDNEAVLNIIIDNLLEVRRPLAAFSAAHLSWKHIDSKRIVTLLNSTVTNHEKEQINYRIDSYEIESAFKTLQAKNDLSVDELVSLEFMYLKLLKDSEYGIPNLEKNIEDSPLMFMQALALAFKRSDNGEDPAEWFENKENKKELADSGYYLLESIKRIPGTKNDGSINEAKLSDWMIQVRQLCREYAREDVGDQTIGKILSSCPIGNDEIWPCEPVRNVIENIGSNHIALGMSIGVQNARGATFVDGGQKERVLAAKYRNWSKKIAFEYPYVSQLLENIAISFDRDAEHWETDKKIRKRLIT